MIRLALLAASLLVSTAAPAATVVTADRYLDVLTGKYVEYPAIFVGDDGRITSIEEGIQAAREILDAPAEQE